MQLHVLSYSHEIWRKNVRVLGKQVNFSELLQLPLTIPLIRAIQFEFRGYILISFRYIYIYIYIVLGEMLFYARALISVENI